MTGVTASIKKLMTTELRWKLKDKSLLEKFIDTFSTKANADAKQLQK